MAEGGAQKEMAPSKVGAAALFAAALLEAASSAAEAWDHSRESLAAASKEEAEAAQ
ncbi:hypothetical protein SEUCBS139899_004457, partial [Sporothrix eucalyptigena]